MTTNTNDMPRTTIFLAASRAMSISDLDAHRVLDDALDLDVNDYPRTDDARRALHTLANALFSSDDDYDDFRLELRIAIDLADDDDRALYLAYNHPFVANDDI
jgi:hypothetical protein